MSARFAFSTPSLLLIGIASASVFFLTPIVPAIVFLAFSHSDSSQKRVPVLVYAILMLICDELIGRVIMHKLCIKPVVHKLRLHVHDECKLLFALGAGHAACRMSQIALPLLPVAFSGAVPFVPFMYPFLNSGDSEIVMQNEENALLPLVPAACVLALLLSLVLPAVSITWLKHSCLPALLHVGAVGPALITAAMTGSVALTLALLAPSAGVAAALLIAGRWRAQRALSLLSRR